MAAKKRPIKETPLDMAAAVLRENPAAFTGLYGPVLRVAEGDYSTKAGPFNEWLIRVRNLYPRSALDEALSERIRNMADWDRRQYNAHALWMLRLFTRAGVTYDEVDQLDIDGPRLFAYVSQDGRSFKRGEPVAVVMPCWWFEGEVVEKGIAR